MAVAAGIAGAAAGASTPTKKWYWSETKAEARALAKVRIPCARVRDAADCDPAKAQAEKDSFDQRLAFCETITEPARKLQCLNSMLTLRSPVTNLDNVLHGFKLFSAECVGGGDPDASGYRFSQFRCQVSVHDQQSSTRFIDVRGRIAIYTTGAKTFRWKVI
jgi:hypothetical protein